MLPPRFVANAAIHSSAADELLPISRVPIALHGNLCDSAFDAVKIVGAQFHCCRTEVLLETMELRRARNRNDPGFLREQPRKRDLRRRRTLPLSDSSEQLD